MHEISLKIMERVWQANDAFARIERERQQGSEPAQADVDQFTLNLNAFSDAQDQLADALLQNGFDIDRTQDDAAIYDALAESNFGEDVETLCLRAIYKVDERRKNLAETTGSNEEEPIQDLSLDVEAEVTETNQAYKDQGEFQGIDDKELVLRIRGGDKDAAEELIKRHTRFIYKLARKMAPNGRYASIDVDDLFQEGVIGLLRAVELADLSNRAKFLTYAGEWIIRRMHNYILDNRATVRTPRYIGAMHDRIRRINSDRVQQQRPLLNDEEITEIFRLKGHKVTPALIKNSELLTYYMGSLDTGFSPSRDSSPGNDYILDERQGLSSLTSEPQPGVDEKVIKSFLQDNMREVLLNLDEREVQILKLRFGSNGQPPKTLEEVGVEFDLSSERVRKIEARALAKLRLPLHSAKLKDFAR